MIASKVEAELAVMLVRFADLRLDDGRQTVVLNGFLLHRRSGYHSGRGFQLSQNVQPKLRIFVFRESHAQQFFMAFDVYAQRQKHRLIDDAAILTYLQDNTVQINNRVDGIQRAILPLHDLLHHRIRHLRDQCRRDIRIVQFLERGGDFPGVMPLAYSDRIWLSISAIRV
ncbi:hypothetical protein BBW68_10050 [Candidatus Erwinia dacicola]|uniref:Uncharacterized protein n=1 Tax=Candidatus Erwinia dacicola TaxID=252393 RepID=A0A1E7Z0N4_9GAMM|nr:hypothetical protein BBW68_10050 [Candidatus Erwinia dacicola]